MKVFNFKIENEQDVQKLTEIAGEAYDMIQMTYKAMDKMNQAAQFKGRIIMFTFKFSEEITVEFILHFMTKGTNDLNPDSDALFFEVHIVGDESSQIANITEDGDLRQQCLEFVKNLCTNFIKEGYSDVKITTVG